MGKLGIVEQVVILFILLLLFVWVNACDFYKFLKITFNKYFYGTRNRLQNHS